MRLAPAFRLLAALSLLLGAGAVAAQSFDFARDRQPVIPLDGLWRFHPGDSPIVNGVPLWSMPAFDDASWTTLRSDRPWSDQGYPDLSGYAWYRFQVRLSAGQGPTSILLAPELTSYLVFVDGRPEGGLGKMPSNIPSSIIRYKEFPLTTAVSPAPRTVQVAIRVWHTPMWAGYVGGGPRYGGNLAGDPGLLSAEMLHHQVARNIRYVDTYAYSITAALVGLVILCLFLFRPAQREYLWFAIMLLAQAADNALFIAQQAFFWPPVPVNDLMDGIFTALTICSFVWFFSLVLEVPIGRIGRVALALAAASPVAAVLYWPGWCAPPVSASVQIAFLLPATGWTLFTLGRRAWQGNLDAQILLLPAGLDIGYFFADNVATVLGQAGLLRNPRILEIPLPLPPFAVQLGTLLHLFFLLALLVFLIRRFALAHQREQQLQGEFEAAREVQQVLLPDALDQCPGFEVECIYQPADQVGGDFFQQIVDCRGGVHIVVGDVSGKGLPAALMVSVLVGAIRSEAAHGADPCALLASLNDRMMGRSQGGFVTCVAAHVTAGGLLTLANAGHLPPYLNSEELPITGSLPLGVIEGARYECTTVQLAPGDRLVFVSDGVVEAQARTGELFGFERTRDLSEQSAEVIARAARRFGQHDDITVVTVKFTGSEQAVAATPGAAAAPGRS